MPRPFAVLVLAGSLLLSQGAAPGQESTAETELLRKEIELLKRENDILKRENELLKKENEVLKQGGSTRTTGSETGAKTSVVVDNVEYVYQGSVRNGAIVFVSVLATSKKGDHAGPNGEMTIVDEDGEKYLGMPAGGFGAAQPVREGVPVRLVWRFSPNPFTGKSSAPSPRITRFVSVMIEQTVGRGVSAIEFRNVPAVVQKPQGR